MGLLDGGNDRNTRECLERIAAGNVQWHDRMFTSVGDTSAEFGKLNSRLYHRVGWEKRSYGRVELTTEGAALLQELRAG